MKKLYTIVAALLLIGNTFAQAPQKMSYQAVIRNSSNALIKSAPVGMKISILQGSLLGTAVYAETQTPTSNTNGLVSLQIGAGTVLTGSFSGIDWANGPYFIKTETDPIGGTNYTIAGTSELMSVPYALFSANATAGPQGQIGLTGPAGVKGDTGAVGPVGPAGAKGDTGAVGPAGPAGAKGDIGAVGAVGPAGAAGAKGDTGAVGPAGAAGAKGDTGAAGPAGAKGDTGAVGPAGANLSVQIVNSNTTLNTNNLFIIASGTIVITLPPNPTTGQTIYIFPETAPASININPNGKKFRQGGIDYDTSLLSDFGIQTNNYALTLIYSGTKWYPVSVN